MKTFFSILLAAVIVSIFAADPAQPKVGKTPVINATNGYGGNLTIRTQLNVGYPNQPGLIEIRNTNAANALSIFVTDAGLLTLSNNATLVLVVDPNSGLDGSTNKFLSAAGVFYEVSGGGAGDTIWTNNAGLIELIGTTNIIYIERSTGLIKIGDDDSGDDAFSTSYRRGWTFESYANDYDNGASGWFKSNDQSTSAQCYVIAYDTDHQDAWQINANPTTSYLRFQEDNQTKLNFQPTIGDGGTPYTFDTSLAHTSGNLAEFKNNGTLKGDLTFNGLWEGRAFGASDTGGRVGQYYSGFTEIDSNDTDYTLNSIALDASDGAPSIRMLSTGETSNFPYVQMRPTEDGSSWTMAQVPFMFNTRTNISADNKVFGIGNNETNIVWVTGSGEVHAKDFVMEASSLRTADTVGHSATIQAHDDDDNVRRTFVTLQNGNTPSLTIAPPSGGAVTLQGILKAADGTSGITQTNTLTIPLVLTNQIIIRNGLIVSWISI